MSTEANINVENNAAKHRFEAQVDGHTAVAMYEQHGDTITFTHTIVPEQLEGRGIGSALARAGLDYARDQQLHVVPQCPFIGAYIRRHKAYADLVPNEHKHLLERS